MTIVHIVLVKLKESAKSDQGFSSFKEQCDALYQSAEIKALAKEMQWGPPINQSRNQGYDWGLYSVFESREKLETYRDHPVHQDFVKEVVAKHTSDLLAYDFEI